MITLALNIRLLSSVPSLTFANTLALIPFPKWIGPYMVWAYFGAKKSECIIDTLLITASVPQGQWMQ